jgi:hypothetical protein
VVRVDIAVPEGFRLEDIRPKPGWRTGVRGDTVRFSGGSMEPFSCAPFSLTGVATEAATLTFPVTLRLADGSTAPYADEADADHDGAQVVYAGTAPSTSTGDDSRWPVVLVAVSALLVVGLVAAVALIRRSGGNRTSGSGDYQGHGGP